jgi:hypothetical protein
MTDLHLYYQLDDLTFKLGTSVTLLKKNFLSFKNRGRKFCQEVTVQLTTEHYCVPGDKKLFMLSA